ncbi:MAG: DUF1844 domain-containing protein [Candidatus Omnitrophica bacterium]|nr:DUF1844 domain-containing protein [Candidatus Omnitrophota bacterium]
MDEPVKKRVDESWKEQAEREKQTVGSAPTPPGQPAPAGPARPAPGAEELPQAQFDLFLSGLAMETLIALGDMPHPATRRQAANLPQAKYLIDLIGILEEKTKGNLSTEEDQLLKDTLYQLRMRYLSKSGGVVPA